MGSFKRCLLLLRSGRSEKAVDCNGHGFSEKIRMSRARSAAFGGFTLDILIFSELFATFAIDGQTHRALSTSAF